MKFNVGDIVKVRTWEDMAAHYEEVNGSVGYINKVNCDYCFDAEMKPTCGHNVRICEITDEGYYVEYDYKQFSTFTFCDWMFEGYEESALIEDTPSESGPETLEDLVDCLSYYLDSVSASHLPSYLYDELNMVYAHCKEEM